MKGKAMEMVAAVAVVAVVVVTVEEGVVVEVKCCPHSHISHKSHATNTFVRKSSI